MASVEAKKKDYHALMKARRFEEASVGLRPCAVALNDKALLSLADDAHVRGIVRTINDTRLPLRERAAAIATLTGGYPDKAKPFAKLQVQLLARADAAEAAAEAARRRKEGVSIGMAKWEVLASSWGRPRKVNKSTYSWGTTEQWVYGGRNYLYFRNGELTSIQH